MLQWQKWLGCLLVATFLGLQPCSAQEAIKRQIAGFPAQVPGETDFYLLSLAGDGAQYLFDREARFAANSFNKHFKTAQRTLFLINKPEIDLSTPIATPNALATALEAMAQHMDVNEDILLLFLTSHGNKNATLAMHGPGGPLPLLHARMLADGLERTGIKRAIIVVSACYSGSWIGPLAGPERIIITAARADRTSFGCSDDRFLTYFGEALFENGLDKGLGLLAAFDNARTLVKTWELRDRFQPSEPQIYIGTALGNEWLKYEPESVCTLWHIPPLPSACLARAKPTGAKPPATKSKTRP
jgi:hypothetical protein